MRSDYQRLVQHNRPLTRPSRTSESDLDSLITLMAERRKKEACAAGEEAEPDRIQMLRVTTIQELVPIFVELKEKYEESGVSMEMDVSNFIAGGREIKFEFGIGDCRSQLLGTVTSEAIAFHETRYAPDVPGELVSGPMLRLRRLDGRVFREFICERLSALVRTTLRR